MASREFVDSRGVAWRVWNTAGSHMLKAEFASGWLTFESSSSLRRLAPIPAGWETVAVAQLERLCGQASETRRISGPHARIDPPGGP
jgi:hypothetical protein